MTKCILPHANTAHIHPRPLVVAVEGHGTSCPPTTHLPCLPPPPSTVLSRALGSPRPRASPRPFAQSAKIPRRGSRLSGSHAFSPKRPQHLPCSSSKVEWSSALAPPLLPALVYGSVSHTCVAGRSCVLHGSRDDRHDRAETRSTPSRPGRVCDDVRRQRLVAKSSSSSAVEHALFSPFPSMPLTVAGIVSGSHGLLPQA